MSKFSIAVVCIILPLLLSAQENLPVAQDVQFEVLTDTLVKNSKAQSLQVQISCNVSSSGQRLNLNLQGVSGLPVLVAAERDGNALWLIQSSSVSDNDIVLAWQILNDTQLQLLPGNWTAPFQLNLEIQISLNNLKELQNLSGTQLDLSVIRNNRNYRAMPTGRGNEIGLK